MTLKVLFRFMWILVFNVFILGVAFRKLWGPRQHHHFEISRSLRIPETVQTKPIVPQFIHNTSLTGRELEEQITLLDNLLTVVTNVTRPCDNLVRQGGKLCKGRLDGDKKICFDSSVRPDPTSCLVYSFGIGFDFSFDAAMGKYGCNVFSFDDDIAHELYGRNPYPNVKFLHVRLSSGSGVSMALTYHQDNHKYIYVYRPLGNIMHLLGHDSANIDVLKIDVDGPEWEIFEESIFKTDILERTKQLSIEVHISVFLDPKLDTGRSLTKSLRKYLSFFEGLETRGMRLTHSEPNLYQPKVARFANRTINVFYELLWVNVHLQKMEKREQMRIHDKILDDIELKA